MKDSLNKASLNETPTLALTHPQLQIQFSLQVICLQEN